LLEAMTRRQGLKRVNPFSDTQRAQTYATVGMFTNNTENMQYVRYNVMYLTAIRFPSLPLPRIKMFGLRENRSVTHISSYRTTHHLDTDGTI
jgi:hypothetical protein